MLPKPGPRYYGAHSSEWHLLLVPKLLSTQQVQDVRCNISKTLIFLTLAPKSHISHGPQISQGFSSLVTSVGPEVISADPKKRYPRVKDRVFKVINLLSYCQDLTKPN